MIDLEQLGAALDHLGVVSIGLRGDPKQPALGNSAVEPTKPRKLSIPENVSARHGDCCRRIGTL